MRQSHAVRDMKDGKPVDQNVFSIRRYGASEHSRAHCIDGRGPETRLWRPSEDSARPYPVRVIVQDSVRLRTPRIIRFDDDPGPQAA